MALRWNQTFPESGDVLNPSDWNLTHVEYAHEMNGYLDRDNFPVGVLNETRIVARAGSDLLSDPQTTSLTTGSNNPDWQDGDGTNYVGRVTFTAEEDCLLDCDFGGTWNWDTSGHPAGYSILAATYSIVNAIRFRIVVDGYTVAESGFDEEGRDRHHTWITGCIPIQAGQHEVKVQYQKCRITNFNFGEGSALDCVVNERELLVHRRKR